MKNFQKDEINLKISENKTAFICECEKAYESQLDKIAQLKAKEKGRHLIMLAGPSSSGKTTTARLLKEKLGGLGRKATVVSLDDFYRNQDVTYFFPDGTVDYETVEALEVPLIVKCLRELIHQGESMLPEFSFKVKRRSGYKKVTAAEDEIFIIEGLHALNPKICQPLNDENLFKLYVSVSSRICDGEDVLFSKRDLRFLRRLIRDYHHRSSEVEYTYYLWKAVRMGEDRYLFPFIGTADVKLNSIHPYEPCLFKSEAIKLLSHVKADSEYFENANSLIQRLSLFETIQKEDIPDNSLLHEFIG
ncbi:MAG: uridine kinase [Acutalibacteraceae bacterium]